ncbi:MAG: cytochrome c3 family protein [Planctomycetota bacterium]
MSSTVGPPQSPAKQRALRIPLDYYKRWTALDRVKWLITAVATLAGAAYAGWVVAGYGGGPVAQQFSPGHVTLVHAAWNDRCDACHFPGAPLNPHAGGSESLRQWLMGGTTPARVLAEQKCVACHPAASHHPKQIADQVETCAACHHDHAGVDADLKQVASERCVACHADISRHSQWATSSLANVSEANAVAINAVAANTVAANVASWAAHPDFRSLDRGDPGRLKFNHRLHLLPGQFARDAKASAPKRLGAIDKSHWRLLGYPLDASPDTVVQLDCSACHEFDSTTGRVGVGSASPPTDVPATGAYAQPIRYDRHCASCHDADLAVSIEGPYAAARASIPHASAPATIRRLLRGAAAASEADVTTVPSTPDSSNAGTQASVATAPDGKLAAPSDSPLIPRRFVPGRSLRGKEDGRATGTRIDAIPITARVQQAERQLAGESHCGKCHPFSINKTVNATGGNDELLTVGATQIPAIWLPKGGFDHSAHRAMRCDACHAASSFEWTGGGKPPIDDSKPKIPRIDNCRQCHGDSPADTKAAVAVRADCVTCHRYHAANEFPHGPGGSSHLPPSSARISTRDWLDGRFPRPQSSTGTTP